MKVYRVDVTICATAYVKARSAADAFKKANALKDCSPSILCSKGRAFNERDHDGGIPISGLQLDDPRLPKLSLSPAMTLHGVWPGATAEETD